MHGIVIIGAGEAGTRAAFCARECRLFRLKSARAA